MAVFVVIAFGFLEGTMRWIFLAVGLMDGIITPIILKQAMGSETT